MGAHAVLCSLPSCMPVRQGRARGLKQTSLGASGHQKSWLLGHRVTTGETLPREASCSHYGGWNRWVCGVQVHCEEWSSLAPLSSLGFRVLRLL